MSKTATYMGKPYYPWWLNELADDVTGQGAAIEGALQGPEEVRTLVLDARELYEDQELGFVGDFGEDGFLEEYTCEIRGVPAALSPRSSQRRRGGSEHRGQPSPAQRGVAVRSADGREVRRHAHGEVLPPRRVKSSADHRPQRRGRLGRYCGSWRPKPG